jgi:integrase
MFQVRRKRAGLPHVRLHDLRHGSATLALEGDVNLELIPRQLGHARIATTIDLYARHEIESVERVAAEKVAALVDARLRSVSK